MAPFSVEKDAADHSKLILDAVLQGATQGTSCSFAYAAVPDDCLASFLAFELPA